ncbi:hypothetical protein [Candidatus Enterovibrio escicola]|uniref:hypothetical protein n=1 Tax=Candidatus Enterovibrio escicola TaxID=1927127 RepID=UPI00123836B9|nr:hypothetical protein [Candidatus Enterovibrio escacola]
MKALDDYLAHKDKTNKKTPVSQAKLDIHKIDEEIKAETVELSVDILPHLKEGDSCFTAYSFKSERI